MRTRATTQMACDCDDCEDIRKQSTVSSGDLTMLEAHAAERVEDYIGSRMTLPMPKGVIIFAMVMMVVMLGKFSWDSGATISGATIGLALLVNGWVAGSAYARQDERHAKRQLEFQNIELRGRLHAGEMDLLSAGRGATAVRRAASDVVQQAKIRQEDLDDEDGNFMYEVPAEAMMRLSDAVGDDG